MGVRSCRGLAWLAWLALLLATACSDPHGRDEDGKNSERFDASAGDGQDSGPEKHSGRDGGDGAMGPADSGADGGGAAPVRPHVKSPDAGGCTAGQPCRDAAIDQACDSRTLAAIETRAASGNVLFVFDRSGSMNEAWNDAPRWQAAGTAVRNALAPLANQLTVGAQFFPSPDPNAAPVCIDPTGIACMFTPGLVSPPGACGVASIDAADQIAFTAGDAFLTAFAGSAGAAPPYAPVPMGLTPLLEALQQAKADLTAASLAGSVAVIIITDGLPNCEWNAAAAQSIVSNWQEQGIATRVIGLPGSDTTATSTLSDLASAGGAAAITAADATSLEHELSSIFAASTRSSLDCTLELDSRPASGEDVHVVVTQDGEQYEAPREVGGDASWALNSDETTLELTGELCSAAQLGRYESIAIEAGCVALPALPGP